MKKSTYVFSKITHENMIVLGKKSPGTKLWMMDLWSKYKRVWDENFIRKYKQCQKRKQKFNRHNFSSFEIVAIDIGNQKKFNADRWK